MVTTRQRVTVQIQCKYLTRIRSSNFGSANRKILSVKVCLGEERENERVEEREKGRGIVIIFPIPIRISIPIWAAKLRSKCMPSAPLSSALYLSVILTYIHEYPSSPRPQPFACHLLPPFMTSIRVRFVLFIPICGISCSLTVPSYPFFMAHFPLFPLTFGSFLRLPYPPFPFFPSFFFQQ